MTRSGVAWVEVRARLRAVRSSGGSATGSSTGPDSQGVPIPAARLDAIVSCLDLTSLGGAETAGEIEALCQAALGGATPPACAAVCVYPQYTSEVRRHLQSLSAGVSVVVVGPAFPSGQGEISERLEALAASVQAGANEIDVVLDWRAFLSGHGSRVFAELSAMREIVAPATLKVILETGALPTPSAVAEVASLALEAGAAFIKTSTGKLEPGAELEPSLVMLETLRRHCDRTGDSSGFKVAGGVRTVTDAVLYATMTEEVLGIDRITPGRFRIGASSLLDALVAAGARGGGR